MKSVHRPCKKFAGRDISETKTEAISKKTRLPGKHNYISKEQFRFSARFRNLNIV